MKLSATVIVLLAFVALAATQTCIQETTCMLENDCRCATTQSPVLVTDTPQLVICSFNDAISDLEYTIYYQPLFSARLNPDGNPVSATFFVSHEYTDYWRVNSLYRSGHEIGVLSITKDPLTEYWLEASVDTLIDEFDGQKQIIARFANIPEEEITGARVPNMALAGDNYFEALSSIDLEYDATFNVMNGYNYFPFTLDHAWQVACASGVCPTRSFPGMWITPIIDLMGDGAECSNVQACAIEGSAEEIADWLMREFNVFYQGNRAPFSLILSSAWFIGTPNAFRGLNLFFDRLGTMSDVFLVSHSKAIEWMRNPTTIDEFDSSAGGPYASCTPRSCSLAKGDEVRYMMSCVNCPAVFPWLGNPQGLAS